MNTIKLSKFLEENNQPAFRLGQIQKAIFQDGVSSFSEITTISKELREALQRTFDVQIGNQMSNGGMLSFEVEKILEAKDGQSVKVLLRLYDGNPIETVLISPKPDTWSVCVSCQVGCQMGCRFCATGKMGFKRDLTAEEITDQILFWKQYLKKNLEPKTSNLKPANISNIVFMGMGEPFNNWENVSESIRILTDEKLFGFGSRSLSVSTSGIAAGILHMANEFPQVNLAISLHFANDEKRDRYMPVNKKDNLEALKNALQKYFQITKRKVFLEYIMLDGINDSAFDARQLAEYIKSIGNVHLLHVNLIRYNTVAVISNKSVGRQGVEKFTGSSRRSCVAPQDDIMLKPSTKDRTLRFKKDLEKLHIHATIRKSLGDEIKGACGQLAGN